MSNKSIIMEEEAFPGCHYFGVAVLIIIAPNRNFEDKVVLILLQKLVIASNTKG